MTTCAHEVSETSDLIVPIRMMIENRVRFDGYKCLGCEMTFVPRPKDSWVTPQEERDAATAILEDIYGGATGRWPKGWRYSPPEVIVHGLLTRIGAPMINLCANILGREAADKIIPVNYRTN